MRLWSQFLRLEKMYECYGSYQVFQDQIPEFLAISSFIKKNNIDTRNISHILKEATDVYHLLLSRAEIQNDIERLKQMKNNNTFNQNTKYQQSIPLGP